jgi:hypothetical protein
VLLFPAEFHRSVHGSETLNIGKSRTSDSHIWGFEVTLLRTTQTCKEITLSGQSEILVIDVPRKI